MQTKRKTALVTGANKGLGYEVARQLGEKGFTVLLGVRNLSSGEEAAHKLREAGSTVEVLELDLTRPETAVAAAEHIRQHHGALDVLINNAGIADKEDGPPSLTHPAAVERTFVTNFFGPLLVTQAMLPLLRSAPAARIVNVSSGLGSLTQNADPEWPFAAIKYLGYNASKAALNMMTVQLAWELRDTPIKVNASDPGYTATDLNQHSGHQTIEEGAEATMRLAILDADGPSGTFSDRHGTVPW